ncbi:MAG: histidine--tRNA ligase [Deltaproteobacteria bacterium]|nr:histidine--tRNA ligase [Deltaproteobacteria bacterium]
MEIRSIRGMNDILPEDSILWKQVRDTMHYVLGSYGFREILIPVLEETRLFQRGIGETTDIVEKEMYTFEDKSGQSLTLRPEATASIVRAYVQHHLYASGKVEKLYFWGPMFRYERPQKGRYRQFYQIDVEAFGSNDPTLDTDIIASLYDFLTTLNVPGVTIEINSLGCPNCRPAYHKALKAYFSDKIDKLCPDCKSRLVRNPLRILDCKVETCHELALKAPNIHEFLCDTCKNHFQGVQSYLEDLHIPTRLNPMMVRGLDYYVQTTFEAVSENLGAQNAVAGGGRYDGLVKQLGGPDIPGIGYAMGMERLIMILQDIRKEPLSWPCDLFIATLGDKARRYGITLASKIRKEGKVCEFSYEPKSLKALMKLANRLNARFTAIIGEDELQRKEIVLRNMATREQTTLPVDDTLTEKITGLLDG